MATAVAGQGVEGDALAASFIRRKRVEHRYRLEGWVYRRVDEERVVHSMFDTGDFEAFARNGFLLVDDVFGPDELEPLRASMDGLREREFGSSQQCHQPEKASFTGQYLYDAVMKERGFARLLEPEPIVDSARSLLGPAVILRGACARVTFPGQPRMETAWHLDFRLDVTPRPPLHTEAPIVGVIVHLDDSDEETGATLVVPGSHQRPGSVEADLTGALQLDAMDAAPEPGSPDPPGAVQLTPRAGSVLFFHTGLWHRVGPNTADGSLRRVLILQFSDAVTRRSFTSLPPPEPGSVEEALVKEAEESGDPQLIELLGRAPNWF